MSAREVSHEPAPAPDPVQTPFGAVVESGESSLAHVNVTMGDVVKLLVGLGACLAVTIVGGSVVPAIAALFPVEAPPHPYFVPEHAVLLYVALPIVILATFGFFMAPGILAVLAAGGCRGLPELLLKAFGAALAVRLVLYSAAKVAGVAVTGGWLLAIDVLAVTVLSALLASRVWRGGGVERPALVPVNRRRVLWIALIPTLGVVLLLPVIFWQDMTDDGLEILEIGRTLITHIVPRFQSASGIMGLGIGMLTMAYPVHWFVGLFGPVEAAARLPFLYSLPLLVIGVVGLIESASPRRLRVGEEVAVLLAFVCYAVTMCYSASYDPYAADIAAPAGSETITILCFIAALVFLWRDETGWFVAFAVLGYLQRPTGLLFLGLLVFGAAVVDSRTRRAWLRRIGLAIAACAVAFVAYELVFVAWASKGAGLGYPSSSILGRFQYLRFGDLSRILFVLVPTGMVPALALLAVKWQDGRSRALTVVCVAYFLLFYIQAFVALHQFVPAMILPLVVLWRVVLIRGFRRWPALVAGSLACLSIWISLPRHFDLYRMPREIGRLTDYRIGDYDGTYEEYHRAVVNRRVLNDLFAPDWFVDDPSYEYVNAPLATIYYSHRFAGAGADINYIAQPVTEPAPAGFTRIGGDSVGAVFVRDRGLWQRQRYPSLRTDYRSPVYDIPRETRARYVGIPAGNYDVNFGMWPIVWRLF